MATQVLGANLRHILDAIPGLDGPPAKIHILKPYRMKVLVKAAPAWPMSLALATPTPPRRRHSA